MLLDIFVSAGGVDYLSSVITLTFTSTVTSIQVNMPVTDDLNYEPDERFEVTLTTTDSDVILNPAEGCVIIEDDDGTFLLLWQVWFGVDCSEIFGALSLLARLTLVVKD